MEGRIKTHRVEMTARLEAKMDTTQEKTEANLRGLTEEVKDGRKGMKACEESTGL
jgi:hypothetical protein